MNVIQRSNVQPYQENHGPVTQRNLFPLRAIMSREDSRQNKSGHHDTIDYGGRVYSTDRVGASMKSTFGRVQNW